MNDRVQDAVQSRSEPVLRHSIREGIAVLTLNRPRQYNALNGELLDALHQALDALAKDESARVVILAAEGKAFCAGHDLKEMRGLPAQRDVEALFASCSAMMQKIVALPQPVIAAVNGIATAAGCQLVAQCDLAIAAEDARFAVSGVNLGLFCSTPAVALSRNVGRKRAAEMLFTGDFVGAQEAAQWGLVNRVVPAAEVMDAAVALARRMLTKPRAALALGKSLFYRQLERALGEAYQDATCTIAANMDTDFAREGVDAFLEKRPPRWP